MNIYKIEIELLSDTAPDWIVKTIDEQLEGLELVRFFDYTVTPLEDE